MRAQACTKLCTKPLPSPIRESEDLDVLGDLENFTIASTRTPSLSLTGESDDLDVLQDLEKFYHCKYQNPPPLWGKS